MSRILVVGGGAAGLMAAGTAAEQGHDVIVLEKMRRPGMKLRITGKGRCNLTNTDPVPQFIEHFGRNGRFLRQAFARFFAPDLMAFCEDIGVPVVTERGGRVFPASGKAPEVTGALVTWAKRAGAAIVINEPVSGLVVRDGAVCGVETAGGKTYEADAVIVATGGSSYPRTGSSGDGYALARAVGHTVTPVRPALVPLESRDVPRDQLTHLNLRNVSARIVIDGKKKAQEFGELTFTATGLSGPIILTVSGMIVDALDGGAAVSIALDLKPALDEKKLDARLLREIDRDGRATFRDMLNSLLPMALIPVCMNALAIPHDRRLHEMSASERKALRGWLKHCVFTIDGYRPLDEAIVTAGGVVLKEIDPRSMESRLVRGLYFAGEVLDLAGDTGGYNLQAAFSTGRLAGSDLG